MSRALRGGNVNDLSDNSDLAFLGAGAKMLAGSLGMGNLGGGLKSVGTDLFGGKQAPDDDKDDAGADDFEDFDDDFDDMIEPDYDNEEDEEDDDGDMGPEDDDAMLMLGDATGAVLDKLGLRRKTFVCDIHHVRLTNLGRRRRDVQVIFTLGAVSGEGGAATLKDVLPSTATTAPSADANGQAPSGSPEDAVAEADPGAAAAGSRGGKKGKGLRGRRGGAETSKPLVFKTDVAAKVERGRTATMKRKFRGQWTGKYVDLGRRVLHMTLVEQTRFGNLVEIGTAELTLLELASGSVQQELTFVERDNRTVIESYRLNFHVHFQENFTFAMRLLDWSGSKLRATDDTGSSDPFLKFYIRGSRGRRYKSWYKLGGLLGRSATTDVQYNTLNPEGLRAKRLLYYHGTRSELENETLRIEVYDYDATSRNDLIGFADVPLRGVLLSGRISTGLAMHSGQSTADGGSGLITAGSLAGAIEMVAEPAHTQFGDVVRRLPNMTYLALHVQSCVDLVGKNVDGMSNPYVTAVWSAVSQQTRVIRSTCAPQYDETLYFPTNLVRVNATELEAKGDVVLYVLHHDQTAPVDIGFCRIPLDRITSAPVKRIEDSGVNVKTRVYEARLLLQQAGVTRRDAHAGEVKVRLFFTPDLPSDVMLQEKQHSAHELPEAYSAREVEWHAEIPYRLLATGRFMCSALDETNTRRFLPTYLSKCAPPREMTDPKHIARMVHMITFQMDAHVQRKKAMGRGGGGGGASKDSGGEELWSSPNYFLDVKKGASEDHAVLQCSLFLGLGLDAYLCVGRLPGGVQQHVWVATREPNGDVLFWETTKGDYYCLPSRWCGLYLEGAADAVAIDHGRGENLEETYAARKPVRPKQKAVEGADADDTDKRKLRAAAALARDKAEREAQKRAQELLEQQMREEKLLYLATEEQWTTGVELNPYETPRDYNASGLANGGGGPRGGGGFARSAGGELADRQRTPGAPRGGANGGTARGAAEASFPGEEDDEAIVPFGGGAGAREEKPSKVMKELDLPPMKEQLPYETLEILANHENVWANLQGTNVSSLGFDLEDDARWLPFIDAGVFEPSPAPRPFYAVARIGPQLPPQRLSALRSQLQAAIKRAYTDWRATRSLRTRWATSLEPTLANGLLMLETAACSSSVTDARAVDKWRGQLLQALPPDYRFVGRALSFSVTTPELVVEHVMANYDYHTNGHKEAMFALEVQCFPHYAAVASTWVYVGVLHPHAKKKRRGDKAEDL